MNITDRDKFKYYGFISHSSSDKALASWLQQEIEKYRVPKEIIGNSGRFRKIPSRLTPIFRDRNDLEAHANLDTRLKEALEYSAFLIIICSPYSANSKWVNSEIKYFKSLGREERILTLIASDEKGYEFCFPSALVESKNNLKKTPLAADIDKDGKKNAKLKIIAGILGISLTELTRREIVSERRRRKIKQSIIFLIVLLITLSLIGGIIAHRQRNIAIENERIAKQNIDVALNSLKEVVYNISSSFRNTEGVSLAALNSALNKAFNDIDILTKQSNDPRIANIKLSVLNELGRTFVSHGNSPSLSEIINRLDKFNESLKKNEIYDKKNIIFSKALFLYFKGEDALINENYIKAASFFREAYDFLIKMIKKNTMI